MDVRFESGQVLFGIQLAFAKGNRLTYRLSEPVAYILVKRRQHDGACDFNVDGNAAFFHLNFKTKSFPNQKAHNNQILTLAPPAQLTFFKTIRPSEPTPGLDATVTVMTQIDAERLPVLARLARSIEFPVSAALFYDGSSEMLAFVETFVARHPEAAAIRAKVALHLVLNTVRDRPPRWRRKPYPVQELRNVALEHSETPYVIYVEGDMVFSPGAAGHLLREAEALRSVPQVASIVPLYSPKDEESSEAAFRHLPSDKAGLRQASLVPCQYDSHMFMDYAAWEKDPTAKPAAPLTHAVDNDLFSPASDACSRSFVQGVVQCSSERLIQDGADMGWSVEPYFLAPRRSLPRYDPAMQYGHLDKMDQIRSMVALGWRWGVNAKAYLVNDQHHAGERLHLRHANGKVDAVEEPKEQHNNDDELQASRDASSSYYRFFHHRRWVAHQAWRAQRAVKG